MPPVIPGFPSRPTRRNPSERNVPLPLPRPRFTVHRLMVAVAVVALISAVVLQLLRVSASMHDHSAILIAAGVAGVSGFWAMRSPLGALGLSVIFCLLLPSTTYDLHVYNLCFD